MTAPFDVCGPLPRGVTVLEASAGTGKTYTIAALAARYVAEGRPLERLLLVTFTRMATGELRERVRERLVGVEAALTRALAGAPPEDAVAALLTKGPPAEVGTRRDRLRRALAAFDAATIATTHGFCQEVLAGLGVAGDLERDTTFVEDLSDLVEQVVDDLYVRKFFGGGTPPFGRTEAAAIVREAVEHPTVTLCPASGEVPELRRRLAERARKELERRKRRLAVLTYEDFLTRLQEVLAKDPQAAAQLRGRYDVVLVDEFQDTDPVQWDILRTAFGQGDVTLILIGDPKQAIYAFRGADVYAYLDAARVAGVRATLDVNWRSDQGLIDAYDALFGGAKLGHEEIVYRRVRAADAHVAPRLEGAGAPLRIRVVPRDQVERTRGGYAANASAREHVAEDLAADVVRLLDSGARVEGRAVRPGDVAVLVRTNRNASLVRDALAEAGLPAVINGAGSVFATAPAREWLRLLQAIERPAYPPRAKSAALTAFLGWTAAEVAEAGEEAWEHVHAKLHDWARVLRRQGIAAMTETIAQSERLPERVLAATDGERRLTDLRHVGQLLHAAAAAEHMGATALTAWLRRRIAEADQDTTDEERSRRLESDAEAVQVLTIHRSKGLEFPVVYLPYLWEPGYIPRGARPVSFHQAGARAIDVGLEGPDFQRHQQQFLVEQRGEDLRLAYVALTRARHQAVLWWAGSWDSRNSPLGRLLFARDEAGNVAPAGTATPTDAEATARFEALAAGAPVGVERAVLGMPAHWSPPPPAVAQLAAAVFDRSLDARWRRTSYSDITAGTYEARVASEPEETIVTDEMPAGAQFGTFVHRVLEATDFTAPDLGAELTEHVAAFRRTLELDAAQIVAWLRGALETPLPFVGFPLRDVARADRLDELTFELPLAGGDEPRGRLTLAAIGAALREHTAPDDPLHGYAERLEDPILRSTVRGYLTGSIDLVVRAGERFALLDYKSNLLAAYGPAALAEEMHGAHYALQSLLYTVALHRYLRWRVPGYAPERNLAGVLYLFLRGMPGEGVFAWRPPPPLVTALSDILDAA